MIILPKIPVLALLTAIRKRLAGRAITGVARNNESIILEGRASLSDCKYRVFKFILVLLGYTVLSGCSSNPHPNSVFKTWGHELAHVVCGRFHASPGRDHHRAYKNIGDWDFTECESGSYNVDVYLYDSYDDLRASMSDDNRANKWAAGYQTRRFDGIAWRTEIHVLRPSTNY